VHLKIAGIIFIFLYCLTWFRVVPETQELMTKMDLQCIGAAHEEKTAYPKGMELLLPYISQSREVSYKNYNVESTLHINNIKTIVIPIAPFISYYSYDVESSGFKCGGSGITHIGLDNELKTTKVISQWIT